MEAYSPIAHGASSAADMETLKHFQKIESYGASSGFPVYGGRL